MCIDRLQVTNHGDDTAQVRLELTFGADFIDLFEVRGMKRERRGDLIEPKVNGDTVVLAYRGLDARTRRTVLRFAPAPQAATSQAVRFELVLAPNERRDIEVHVTCECDGEPRPAPQSFNQALATGRGALERRLEHTARIETSNPLANLWLERSSSDLAMLTTDLPSGPYPFAGVPWYSTVFGRDGIITAIECLWMDPSLARGVLRFLAATQALALAPSALCEVLGYAYEARRQLGPGARALGEHQLAARLQDDAEDLRHRFEAACWCDDLGMYAIALDGNKQRCDVLSSNPGHCLWTGIVGPERAARVTKTLLSRDFFSGWGIRTIAYGQSRYNPMSYHNGSVWPHDTALAALGMARYGHTNEAVEVATAVFEASQHFELSLVPERYCGFARREAAGPTRYPVACSPQAWAAASPFALVQACLGIEVKEGGSSVVMHSPRLPAFVDWMRLTRLGSP